MSQDHLLSLIDKLRLDLYEVSREKNLTDPEVVRLSQLLDKVLNWYWEQFLRMERAANREFWKWWMKGKPPAREKNNEQ